jgi:hypothetical protein
MYDMQRIEWQWIEQSPASWQRMYSKDVLDHVKIVRMYFDFIGVTCAAGKIIWLLLFYLFSMRFNFWSHVATRVIDHCHVAIWTKLFIGAMISDPAVTHDWIHYNTYNVRNVRRKKYDQRLMSSLTVNVMCTLELSQPCQHIRCSFTLNCSEFYCSGNPPSLFECFHAMHVTFM